MQWSRLSLNKDAQCLWLKQQKPQLPNTSYSESLRPEVLGRGQPGPPISCGLGLLFQECLSALSTGKQSYGCHNFDMCTTLRWNNTAISKAFLSFIVFIHVSEWDWKYSFSVNTRFTKSLVSGCVCYAEEAQLNVLSQRSSVTENIDTFCTFVSLPKDKV